MNRYEALKHAVQAHAGQVDKCGEPYILHPMAVAEVFERAHQTYLFPTGPETNEDAVVVALLHDVWEDTDYNDHKDTDYNDHNGWLTRSQRAALEALARGRAERYYDYIDRCAQVPLAAIVKLADLWHNLQPERQDCLPEKERKGLEKRYLKARDRTWEALAHEWWPEGGGQ